MVFVLFLLSLVAPGAVGQAVVACSGVGTSVKNATWSVPSGGYSQEPWELEPWPPLNVTDPLLSAVYEVSPVGVLYGRDEFQADYFAGRRGRRELLWSAGAVLDYGACGEDYASEVVARLSETMRSNPWFALPSALMTIDSSVPLLEAGTQFALTQRAPGVPEGLDVYATSLFHVAYVEEDTDKFLIVLSNDSENVASGYTNFLVKRDAATVSFEVQAAHAANGDAITSLLSFDDYADFIRTDLQTIVDNIAAAAPTL